jgi:rare lipoprotein A (peptidoglycan hydrolase)
LRLPHGPSKDHPQLQSTRSRRARGLRIAAAVACLALMSSGVGSAFAQTSGSGGTTIAPDPSDPVPVTQTPVAPGQGWTATQKATWYGPGLWGRSTACGQVLNPTVIGVANKNLPCGTNVTFTYAGRSATATVIDRGPYRKGYSWDLTKKLAKRIGFLATGAGTVTATVLLPPGN